MATEIRDFRGRNDDGTEVTATWIDTINTDWSQTTDVNFRCRLNVYSDAKGNNSTIGWYYRKNGGTWTAVTTTSSNVKATNSTEFTDANDCVQRLGSGSFETVFRSSSAKSLASMPPFR